MHSFSKMHCTFLHKCTGGLQVCSHITISHIIIQVQPFCQCLTSDEEITYISKITYNTSSWLIAWQQHWKATVLGSDCKNVRQNACTLYSTVQFCLKKKKNHNKAYVMSPWLVAGELDIWSLNKRSAFTSGIIHILWCKTTFCVAQYTDRQATKHKY